MGGFFSADRTSRCPFSAVLRNFQKSAVRLRCVFSAYAADFLDVIYGVRPPNGSPAKKAIFSDSYRYVSMGIANPNTNKMVA